VIVRGKSAAGALAVLATVGAAGCGTADEDVATSAAGTSWELALDAILEDARAGGAGQRQIEVLETARAAGSLEYETVVDLTHDTFACFEAAGIGYRELPGWERAPGWTIVQYSFSAEAPGLTEAQVLALADACMAEHSRFAEFVLQDAALHQEARDERMRAHLPTILACLADNGVHVDADATLDEVRLAALELLNATADFPETVACWDDLATAPN
jgi:hypothetical protein